MLPPVPLDAMDTALSVVKYREGVPEAPLQGEARDFADSEDIEESENISGNVYKKPPCHKNPLVFDTFELTRT